MDATSTTNPDDRLKLLVDDLAFAKALRPGLFGWAHDVSSAVSMVAGNLEILELHLARSGPVNPAVQRAIDNAKARTVRIGAEIRFLGATAYLGADSSFSHVVKELIKASRYFAASRLRMRLDVDIAETLPRTEVKVAFAVKELINNALTAVSSAGTQANRFVSISISHTDTDVVITVRDSGGGIAPEIVPLIWSPFFSTWRDHAGIGLYVARELVVAAGGTLAYEPQGSEGSAFTVKSPIQHRSQSDG